MEDLTGERFGRLMVIKFSHKINRHPYFECLCDCGKTKITQSYSLIRGATKSCGCLHDEGNAKKHGLYQHSCYRVYDAMIARCHNIKNSHFKDYGGRGIIVCDEWRNDRIKFLSWALSNGWQKGLHLDRIDNNSNYEPSNCRFVTRKVNGNNKRSNRLITHKGQTKTLSEWADLTGKDRRTIAGRLKYGWSVERALAV